MKIDVLTCCTDDVDLMRWTNNGTPNIDPKIENLNKTKFEALTIRTCSHTQSVRLIRAATTTTTALTFYLYKRILNFNKLKGTPMGRFQCSSYSNQTCVDIIHTDTLLITQQSNKLYDASTGSIEMFNRGRRLTKSNTVKNALKLMVGIRSM